MVTLLTGYIGTIGEANLVANEKKECIWLGGC